MNIAADEEEEEAMHCGKASEPSESVLKAGSMHSTAVVKGGKGTRTVFFFLKALQYPQSFGVAACSARFFCVFLSLSFFFFFLSFFKSAMWIWCYFATQAGIVWRILKGVYILRV